VRFQAAADEPSPSQANHSGVLLLDEVASLDEAAKGRDGEVGVALRHRGTGGKSNGSTRPPSCRNGILGERGRYVIRRGSWPESCWKGPVPSWGNGLFVTKAEWLEIGPPEKVGVILGGSQQTPHFSIHRNGLISNYL
jgi:hypothetical protein